MEIFISALVGDLASRSISFVINKSCKQKVLDVEGSLQRLLRRAEVIIDEATGRHITNEAMLQQLGMLRDAIYQGNYTLDTFRYQSDTVEDAQDPVVSRSFPALSKVNSLKEICCSNRKTKNLEKLQAALDDLSSMVLDVRELVVILTSYPRLYRQPYSMHLLLNNYMFGRQMEAQLVMSFLFNAQPLLVTEELLEVLPIVGPYRVGKSTLVSHVCKDERVRDHFSEILLLSSHDFANYDLTTTLSKGCAMEHENHVLNSNKRRRLLLVVELIGDLLNEDAWNKLCSSYKEHVPRGSKIIITSQSDKIIKFGTAPPLRLKYLTREAYWYFFKTLTFESTDPMLHPRFADVALEISRLLGVCLIGANVTASVLRNNFDIHYWCKVLTFLRQLIQKNVSKYGGHPFIVLEQNRPVHLWRMATPSEDFVLYCHLERSSQEEVPKIRLFDLLYGNAKPRGKCDVLSWRSPIPPYKSYGCSCDIRELKTTGGSKRKRSIRSSEITFC